MSRRLGAVLLLLGLLLPALPVHAAEALTIAAYADRLQRFAAAAREGAELADRGAYYLAERDRAVGLLAGVVRVSTPAGDTPVDHGALLAQVQALGSSTARPAAAQALRRAADDAEQRLALARATGEVTPGLDLGAAASRLAALQASRARAQRATPGWLRLLLDRAQQLVERAVRAVADLFTRAPGDTLTIWVARLASLALLALVAWLLWRWLRTYLRSARAASEGGAPGRGRAAGRLSPEALRAEAARLAAAGDYLGALRSLHLALLRKLDAADLVSFRPAAANGEYLRQVRSLRPDLYEPLRRLTDLLESRWYGGLPATAADVSAGESLLSVLWEEVGASAAQRDPN